MPSRASLEARANSLGLDTTLYPNDSKLEQKIIYLERTATAFTGALGVGTLTSDATAPSNLDTVTIGSQVYTFVTTLASAKATGTLTSDATAPSDTDTVTIGSTVYTFKTTLTPTAYEVLIGASAAAALDNLKSAINASAGAGTTYATGTAAHPTVTATTNTDTTQVVEAISAGPAGDAIVTTEAGTHTSWGAATLQGGNTPAASQVLIGVSAAVALDNLKSAINGTTGGGTTYSDTTPVHLQVTATTNTDTTQVVQARDYSVTNADIATTEASSHLSWGAATLASGTPKITAKSAMTLKGLHGGANVL